MRRARGGGAATRAALARGTGVSARRAWTYHPAERVARHAPQAKPPANVNYGPAFTSQRQTQQEPRYGGILAADVNIATVERACPYPTPSIPQTARRISE